MYIYCKLAIFHINIPKLVFEIRTSQWTHWVRKSIVIWHESNHAHLVWLNENLTDVEILSATLGWTFYEFLCC